MVELMIESSSSKVVSSALEYSSYDPHTTSEPCSDSVTVERWQDIATFILLGIINLFVIVGNMLVIVAVFTFKKLRTVTNFFIVSLALADLLVGVAVLPYSIALEVLGVWIFGPIWCTAWLAVDVWMCTASILNLCAISLDRYIAITRPVHYRNIMTKHRAKFLIAFVWVLSFIICFPPLVGWNDDRSLALPAFSQNDTFNFSTIVPSGVSSFPSAIDEASYQTVNYDSAQENKCTSYPECVLINNMGYVIYSALGSFYIPLLVMLFFYWKIYRAAIKTSRALERGFKRTKSTKKRKKDTKEEGPEEYDEQRVMLRIHRGPKYTEVNGGKKHVMIDGNSKGNKLFSKKCRTGLMIITTDCVEQDSSTTPDTSPRPSCNNNGTSFRMKSDKEKGKKNKSSEYAVSDDQKREASPNKETSSADRNTLLVYDPNQSSEDSGSIRSGKGSSRSFFSRMSSRNARIHAKRFRSEAKATKTVGIIVGGFISCWLPFFIIYLIRAFCPDCFPALLFSIFFWLGYCNSAVNPLIYAHFSNDFRTAFKKILFKCHYDDEGVSSLIRQIHMATFLEDNLDDNQDSR